MKKTHLFLPVLLMLLNITVAGPAAAGDDDKLHSDDSQMVDAIFDEALVSGETYRLLDSLCNHIGPRLSGSENAAKAVAWTQQIMHDYGFDRVFLQEIMVPHWERGSTARAVAHDPGSGSDIDLSVIAIGGSVATPAGGVTAEVVEVHSLAEVAELGRDTIAGKIVFYSRPFEQRNILTGRSYGRAVDQRVQGATQAAKYGAVAVVIRSVSSAFDDAPHTGALRYADGTDRIPAAALGVQSALRLSALLKQQKSVELSLQLDCRWLPDAKSYNVIGEITGSEFPQEIILVGGHLDSWDVGQGAHDDGAGSMHAITAVRTLQKLGYRPRHTLRTVLFMNEENGLRGGRKYAELAKQNGEKHLVLIESDAGGFTPRGFGVSAADSVIDKMRTWLPHFDNNTITYIRKGGGGADIGPLHRAQDVPSVGFIPDSQRYFDLHHSPHDVFAAVNRRELELGTASIAALIYFIDKYGL